MNQYLLPILAVCALVAASCKKDSNKPDIYTVAQPCELCAYADSLSGNYAGWYTGVGIFLPDGEPCSLAVSLEHIFLNLGSPQDSTTMYFKRTLIYDTPSEKVTCDTVAIDDYSGQLVGTQEVTFLDPHHFNVSYSVYNWGVMYVTLYEYNCVR